jgi:hypothetical protein
MIDREKILHFGEARSLTVPIKFKCDPDCQGCILEKALDRIEELERENERVK